MADYAMVNPKIEKYSWQRTSICRDKNQETSQPGSTVPTSSEIMDLTKEDDDVPLPTDEEMKDRAEHISAQQSLILTKARQEEKKNLCYEYWEQTKFSAMEHNWVTQWLHPSKKFNSIHAYLQYKLDGTIKENQALKNNLFEKIPPV